MVFGASDKAYKDFSEKISAVINTATVPIHTVSVPIQINKLCRAVIGHFLAAKNFYDGDCLVDVRLRDYILGRTDDPGVKLFYWIYPFETVFNIRDIVARGNNLNDPFIPQGMISVIVSYLVVYMLAEKDEEVPGLHDLFEYTTDNIEELVKVPIDFTTAIRPGTNEFRHIAWPCTIGDEIAFVLSGKAGSEDSRLGVPIMKGRG